MKATTVFYQLKAVIMAVYVIRHEPEGAEKNHPDTKDAWLEVQIGDMEYDDNPLKGDTPLDELTELISKYGDAWRHNIPKEWKFGD